MVFVVVLVLAGCAGATPASVAPTLVPPAVVAESIRFRSELGLRADEGWVRAVEADPGASGLEFGVRLLPFEVAELKRRARNADEVAPVVRAYGIEHADAFGGTYIDPRNGVVVALFTMDVETHDSALRSRLHPAARWSVEAARFTEAALNALHDRLNQDRDWFKAVGIHLGSSSTDVPENRVEVTYFSLDPAAGDLIVARYRVGEMLAATHDPNATFLLPRGSLRGRVIGRDGRPAPDLLIEAVGEIGNAEPDGGVGIVTRLDGSFFIQRLAAMGWEIRALAPVPNDGWRVVGKAHVVVHEAENGRRGHPR